MARSPELYRNVVLLGAGGAGKTTLAEHLLHLAKVTNRLGTVADKNTVSDWDEDEKSRQHSILATPMHLPWDNHKIQLIDTPGAIDFMGEAAGAIAAVETALIVVNAHDGVGVATRKLFRRARDAGLACVVVINRVDTPNVDGADITRQVRTAIGDRAVPLNLPDTWGPDVSEVIDVFADDVPGGLEAAAAQHLQDATDRVVECDEGLMERYFETGTVTKEELADFFPRALRQGNIVPIVHVSMDKGVGMRKLLDFVVKDCPPPIRRNGDVIRKAKNAAGEQVAVAGDAAFSAQVWKIQVDPHVGKLAFFRVWSGALKAKSHIHVKRTGQDERIGDLLEAQGHEHAHVDDAIAGSIVAVAKVDDIQIGDTLTDGQADWVFTPVAAPEPKVTLAIEPKNRNDEAKIGPELARIAESDLAFVAEREKTTGEMVVRGLSALHIDVNLARLARKKVEVVTHQPRIPYLETVSAKGESMYRHKKQSGGRGQFAEVHLKVEPLTRGEGFDFSDEIVGGTIPRQFIPAVEKGVREMCEKGVLAGYPFVDVRVRCHFGKYHDVDSDEFSFKLASGQAFKLAVNAAKPVILEPVMHVTIEVPSRFMGDISGDLNSRRGRILGMNQEGDEAIIEANVPLSEMMNYSTELRSITAGEGDFGFKLDHYDPVPNHLASDIIAKAKTEEVHA